MVETKLNLIPALLLCQVVEVGRHFDIILIEIHFLWVSVVNIILPLVFRVGVARHVQALMSHHLRVRVAQSALLDSLHFVAVFCKPVALVGGGLRILATLEPARANLLFKVSRTAASENVAPNFFIVTLIVLIVRRLDFFLQ